MTLAAMSVWFQHPHACALSASQIHELLHKHVNIPCLSSIWVTPNTPIYSCTQVAFALSLRFSVSDTHHVCAVGCLSCCTAPALQLGRHSSQRRALRNALACRLQLGALAGSTGVCPGRPYPDVGTCWSIHIDGAPDEGFNLNPKP